VFSARHPAAGPGKALKQKKGLTSVLPIPSEEVSVTIEYGMGAFNT
jgi:hypothetical protein